MHEQTNAELHVLDRMMYLLEEGSVERLTREDATFDGFIEQLYQNIRKKAVKLQETYKSVQTHVGAVLE